METGVTMNGSGNPVAIIMAGGVGTRFWPLSTNDRPKQFLTLSGDRSLLQQSCDRISGYIPPERIMVLTQSRFTGLVAEQLPGIPTGNIIGEPLRRDTAAAITIAAIVTQRRFGNAVMVILTADHLIEPEDAFLKAVESAVEASSRDHVLYTFGIPPTYPATGYGYIEFGREILDDSGIKHFELTRFREKPDEQSAQTYIDSGRYLWNSGMFVWQTDVILRLLETHLPGHISAISTAVGDDSVPLEQALATALEPLRAVSIDYGVMEHASPVRCIAAPFSWSDIGGWNALGASLEEDADGNAHRCRLTALDAARNMAFCENGDDEVILIGVDDLIVARSGSRILVAAKDRVDELKAALARDAGNDEAIPPT